MKHQVYGGANFPFVTSVQIPMVRWILYAALLSPIALIVGGLAALIWWLV
jgi:hypothetical protein